MLSFINCVHLVNIRFFSMFPIETCLMSHFQMNLLIDLIFYRIKIMIIHFILLFIQFWFIYQRMSHLVIFYFYALLQLLLDLFYFLCIKSSFTRGYIQFIKNWSIRFLFLNVLSEKLSI